MERTLVFYAELPEHGDLSPVFPNERNEEIARAKSEKAKREKYFVWKLLGYALEKTFGKPLSSFTFRKSETGKWFADGVEFSLTHSGKLLAVVLSDRPVGIDGERLAPRSDALAKKVLSAEEYAEYARLQGTEKTEYFTRKWTEKESAFKALNGKSFFSEREYSGAFETRRISLGNENYLLTVAVENGETAVFSKGEV